MVFVRFKKVLEQFRFDNGQFVKQNRKRIKQIECILCHCHWRCRLLYSIAYTLQTTNKSKWKWVICRNVHILIVYSSEKQREWTLKPGSDLRNQLWFIVSIKMYIKFVLMVLNGQHCTRAIAPQKIHIFTSHICPWHLKSNFSLLSLSKW